MCEFISWIDKGGQLYYLTRKDIYQTRRGLELRAYCKSASDLIGHGAIRYYYDNFVGGQNRECTDFSTPDNFPAEIVTDIKAGKFRGLGIAKELLSAVAQDKYYANTKPLLDDKYDADKKTDDKHYANTNTLYDKYVADRKTLDDKYDADRKTEADMRTLFGKYYATTKPLYDKYDADKKTMYDKYYANRKRRGDKYVADINNIFWDLFRKQGNRNPLWRN